MVNSFYGNESTYFYVNYKKTEIAVKKSYANGILIVYKFLCQCGWIKMDKVGKKWSNPREEWKKPTKSWLKKKSDMKS